VASILLFDENEQQVRMAPLGSMTWRQSPVFYKIKKTFITKHVKNKLYYYVITAQIGINFRRDSSS